MSNIVNIINPPERKKCTPRAFIRFPDMDC